MQSICNHDTINMHHTSIYRRFCRDFFSTKNITGGPSIGRQELPPEEMETGEGTIDGAVGPAEAEDREEVMAFSPCCRWDSW